MVKDGEDWHGLQTLNLKKFRLDAQTVNSSFKSIWNVVCYERASTISYASGNLIPIIRSLIEFKSKIW